MSRKKRNKNKQSARGPSNVSHRLLVKIELDKLFQKYEANGFDREAEECLETLFDDYQEDVIADLLKRLDEWAPEKHAGLVWALSVIGDEEVVEKLWEVVHAMEKPFDAKLTALAALEQLGEEVDLKHPPIAPEHYDPEYAKQTMDRLLDQVLTIFERAESSDELQQMMVLIDEMKEKAADGDTALLHLIESVYQKENQTAADFLQTFSEMASDKAVRKEAGRALYKLKLKGIEPQSKLSRAIQQPNFYRAYLSDLEEIDDQQQVFVAWELEEGKIQVFSFLIDFWDLGGAVKDFFVTPTITKLEFADIVRQSEQAGIPMLEMGFSEAKEAVEEALATNQEGRVPLPDDLKRYRRLVEQRILEVRTDQEDSQERGEPVLRNEEERETLEVDLIPQFEVVQQLFVNSMVKAEYREDQIESARKLWWDYNKEVRPNIRKPEVWAASVEYTIARLDLVQGETQSSIEKKYAVSPGSISSTYGKLCDTLEITDFDDRYSTVEDPYEAIFGPFDFLDVDDLEDDWEEWEQEEYEEEDYPSYELEELCDLLIEDIEAYIDALEYLEDKILEACNEGRLEKAQSQLNRLIQRYRSVPKTDVIAEVLGEVYYLMGELWREQKQFVESIQYYKKAVAAHKYHLDAYYAMGEAYWESGEYAQAIKIWEQELGLAPDHSDTRLRVAEAWEKLGKEEKALSILHRVLDYDANSVVAMDRLRRYHLRTGETVEAEALKHRILELETPTGVENVEIWVKYQIEADRLDEAVEFLEQEEERFPLVGTFNLLKSLVYWEQGNWRMRSEFETFQEKYNYDKEYIEYAFEELEGILGKVYMDRFRSDIQP